jgi:thiamine pyrophosphokinase
MSRTKKAMICLNGQPPQKNTLQRFITPTTQIIAADGGCNWLMDYGIVPHVVIGDLDSVLPEHLRKIPSIRMEDQHATDLEKAFAYALEQGVTHVDLLGIEAGRVDHMLANFFLLWSYHQKISLRILGDQWVGYFLKKQQTLLAKEGSLVSIIPFTACSGIFLDGFRYNLVDASWRFGEVGVSNVIEKSPSTIAMKQGKALVLVFDVNAQMDGG